MYLVTTQCCVTMKYSFEKRIPTVNRPAPANITSGAVSHLWRLPMKTASGLVEHTTDPKLLHSPVAFIEVEADEMPALAVRNDSAPHEARDVAHATLEVQRDFAFGFPVFAGSCIGWCCSIHDKKFGTNSRLRRKRSGLGIALWRPQKVATNWRRGKLEGTHFLSQLAS